MRTLTFLLSLLCAVVVDATSALSFSPASASGETRVGLTASGYHPYITQPVPEGPIFTDSDSLDLYERGKQDARLFYRPKGAFWISFGITVGTLSAPATLSLPGAGTGLYLIPALGAPLTYGLIKPREKNLKQHDVRYRNSTMVQSTDQLFQDRRYVEGYRKGSRQRKLGKTAAGMGAGLGTVFLITLVFATVAMSGG